MPNGIAAVGRTETKPHDGTIITDMTQTITIHNADGLELSGSGLSATLRDYGRFGLFLLGSGKAGGEQVLPENWVQEAGSPKMIGGQSVNYGYLLWTFPNSAGTINEGAFEGRGIFGQRLYVNPRENVVIVVWSALPKPTGKVTIAYADFFAAASQAMRVQASGR